MQQFVVTMVPSVTKKYCGMPQKAHVTVYMLKNQLTADNTRLSMEVANSNPP